MTPYPWPLRSYLELGALPTAVPCARLHARHLLWEWGLNGMASDAELLVSELVTNAVKATAGQQQAAIRLQLSSDSDSVLVEVWDADPQPPAPKDLTEDGTPDLQEEIANIKHRIERDVVGTQKLERDVKLGRGGIREIEFIVQTLQLIHGARNPFLQEPSMLKALYALRQLDLLPREEVLALDNAYRFLRRVEHRLQIEAEVREQGVHAVQRQAPAFVQARVALNKALAAFRAEKFTTKDGRTFQVTFSAGVAEVKAGQNVEQAIAEADQFQSR